MNKINFVTESLHKKELERIMEQIHFENFFEDWIKNFSLNLNNIWQEYSARDLDPTTKSQTNNSAIVIGAGPSIKKYNHLELLAQSNYEGSIICTDRFLKPALMNGITPDKFPKFYVLSIDTANMIKNFYDDKIIKTYGNKINGVFSTVIDPQTVETARNAGIKIHWLHPLIDYEKGKKSVNQILGLMVRAKHHHNGLPGIQTGGNVGTSSWFFAWQILKCKVVCLIGINHSWDEDDSWESITAHCNLPKNFNKNSPLFKKMFPKIYNPEFDCTCILDPIFQFYSNALKEFILRSPSSVKTINATEGGCIFGKRITCMKFSNFLKKYDD